jgi:Haem-degrading
MGPSTAASSTAPGLTAQTPPETVAKSPRNSIRWNLREFTPLVTYTAVSMGPMFGVDTSSGIMSFITSKNPVGLSNIASGSADLLFIPGGALIKAHGQTAGAIGVSGAPLSSEDEVCAQAGIAKIQNELDAAGNR